MEEQVVGGDVERQEDLDVVVMDGGGHEERNVRYDTCGRLDVCRHEFEMFRVRRVRKEDLCDEDITDIVVVVRSRRHACVVSADVSVDVEVSDNDAFFIRTAT